MFFSVVARARGESGTRGWKNPLDFNIIYLYNAKNIDMFFLPPFAGGFNRRTLLRKDFCQTLLRPSDSVQDTHPLAERQG